MRVLIAPDKFKGTADAVAVSRAMATAVEELGHVAVVQPMADGGEGTLGAFGGPNRTATVSGPLGEPVEAAWRLGSARTAVIEMAQASGLSLVGGAAGNDPIAASTAGTGELIDAAIQRNVRHIIIGVGGSATTDGGWGAVQALQPVQRLRGIEMTVACDVSTPFLDAAAVFGPQKGATEAQVELLRRRLQRTAQVYEAERGVDVTAIAGAGAAGGLAGGLAALGARLVPGFEVVADAVGLDELVEAADLVITGEGQLDRTSAEGKVIGGLAELAAEFSTPIVAVVGQVTDDVDTELPVFSLVDHVGAERAMTDTCAAITEVTRLALRSFGTPPDG
jgi:glycerate kinase